MMKKQNSWFVFDFGGVLTIPIKKAVRSLCSYLSVKPEQLSMISDLFNGENSPLHELERGRITEYEFQQQIAAGFPEPAATLLLTKPFHEIWFNCLRAEQRSLAMVNECAQRGVNLALFTNNVIEWRPQWVKMVDLEQFDVVIDSCLVGTRKPELEIYEILKDRLSCEYDDMLLIDDSPENIEMAVSLRMNTILWNDADTSLPQLRDLLGRATAADQQ